MHDVWFAFSNDVWFAFSNLQAQLCALVNFLHLVYPEDMSPKSMSAKEVSEALPAHGFSVPDLYPERVYVYDDSHDEGYDSA